MRSLIWYSLSSCSLRFSSKALDLRYDGNRIDTQFWTKQKEWCENTMTYEITAFLLLRDNTFLTLTGHWLRVKISLENGHFRPPFRSFEWRENSSVRPFSDFWQICQDPIPCWAKKPFLTACCFWYLLVKKKQHCKLWESQGNDFSTFYSKSLKLDVIYILTWLKIQFL